MAKFSGIKSPTREGRDEARAMAAYEKELAKKRERAELEAAYGSPIVDADFKKQFKKEKAGQLAFENAKRALAGQGQTEEQAMAGANEARVVAMATPAERFFMESRKRDQAQRAAERGKAVGQFEKDVNTSVGFGEQSSLLKPEGRQRAVKAGMKAGLSFAESDTAVQNAFGLLKEVGKRDKWKSFAPPEQYGPPKELANVAAVPTTTPAAPKPPVEVTPTPVKPSAVSEVFLGENQEGAEGSPTRGVIRGTKAGATVYGALEKKVGGAKNIVEEYNKSGIGSRLDDLKTSAADATKATERAAARMQKFEDKWKGKSPKAGSASERAAVSEYNNLKERLDTAEGRQAASNKLAQEASEATSKAAAAEKVVGGIGGKIVGAGEKVGKFFAPLAPLAKPLAPVARIAGKVAGPAFEIYDAAKYFTGDEGEKAKYAESAATLGSRLFTPKSGGEFLGAVGDVLSPTKNVLGVVESGRQLSRSSRDARESEAAADTAQKLFDARQAARRADYTDEQFKALSLKERTDYLKKLRERVKVKKVK